MTEMNDAMNAEKMIEIVSARAEAVEHEPDKRAPSLDPGANGSA